MWLNFIVLIIACLCVGFILGWVVGRPRRWGAWDADALGTQGVPEAPVAPGSDDQTGAGPFARRG
jgi:hypothetical protein